MDYNELVDDLVEEHIKRDVFTTDKKDLKEIKSPSAESCHNQTKLIKKDL
jgi:hypothetical protein